MKAITSNNIVFITGCFVHHSCWDEWQNFFRAKGFTTCAPPWPFKNASVEELRSKHPDNNRGLALLSLHELKNYYAGIIRSFPEKPIVIGHSFGGLLTQLIVNEDIAEAGVAIHPVPPKGIIPYEFSFLKAGWKALGLFTPVRKTYMMSFKDWQYAFVNNMNIDEQKYAYDSYTIPESKTVNRGAVSKDAYVDFKKQHAPLLITAGSTDHIIPAHLNRRNWKAYKKNGSVTDFKLFPSRNHYVLGQSTWEEDADYIYKWLSGH